MPSAPGWAAPHCPAKRALRRRTGVPALHSEAYTLRLAQGLKSVQAYVKKEGVVDLSVLPHKGLDELLTAYCKECYEDGTARGLVVRYEVWTVPGVPKVGYS